ncbi:MAG: glycosyltransferase [Sporolactobacillus sp.]
MKGLLIRSGLDGIYPVLEQEYLSAWRASGNTIDTVRLPEQNHFSDSTLAPYDLIVMFNGRGLSEQCKQQLASSSAAFFVWQTEDPFYIDQSVALTKWADHTFTVDEGVLDHYHRKAADHPVTFLPLGTSAALFHPQPPEPQLASDLLLIGYPYPNRARLIRFLLTHTSCTIKVIGQGWHNALPKSLRRSSRLQVINHWLDPDETARHYCSASIVLNPHRSSLFPINSNSSRLPNLSLNNRAYDLAACRAFQLIDRPLTKSSGFTSQEIISYTTPEDCLNKVKHYLENDALRNQIAGRACVRAFLNHRFEHRIAQIIQQIHNLRA